MFICASPFWSAFLLLTLICLSSTQAAFNNAKASHPNAAQSNSVYDFNLNFHRLDALRNYITADNRSSESDIDLIPRKYFFNTLSSSFFNASIQVSYNSRLLTNFRRMPDDERPPLTSGAFFKCNDSHATTQLPCSQPRVTIVTVISSFKYLADLIRLSRSWTGYISATLRVTVNEIPHVQKYLSQYSNVFQKTIIHLLIVKKWGAQDFSHMYNAAMDSALTDIIWTLPRGFIPSSNAYTRLHEVLLASEDWKFRLWYGRMALVFHVINVGSKDQMQKLTGIQEKLHLSVYDKNRIKKLYPSNFQSQHDSVWLNATAPYVDSLSKGSCRFILLSRRSGIVPKLWKGTSLHEWYLELEKIGYTFYRDSDVFLLHFGKLHKKPPRASEPSLVSKAYHEYLNTRYEELSIDARSVDPNGNTESIGLKDDGSEEGCRVKHVDSEEVERQVYTCGYHDLINDAVIAAGHVQYEKELYVFPNAISSRAATSRKEITLALQVTMDKYPVLQIMAENWPGPVSCVVYLSNTAWSLRALQQFVLTHGRVFGRWTFHVAIYETSPMSKAGHPINILRNVALHAVDTDMALPVDADFIPNPDLYARLTSLVTGDPTWGSELRHRKGVMIVPAFELHKSRNKKKESQEDLYERLPHTKVKLLRSLRKGSVSPFHEVRARGGHFATDYEKWRRMAETDAPYPIGKSSHTFEPYFLVDKRYSNILPEYPPAFRGFGYNKIAWVLTLKAAGYHFYVFPGGFLIHLNHEYPGQRVTNNAMRRIFHRFYCNLLPIYGTDTPELPVNTTGTKTRLDEMLGLKTELKSCYNQELSLITACRGYCSSFCQIKFCYKK